MKQLRKDITKELLKFYHGIESCKEATENKIIKEPPTAEQAFAFVLIKAKEMNEKLSTILDKYQNWFERIEQLMTYFERNE